MDPAAARHHRDSIQYTDVGPDLVTTQSALWPACMIDRRRVLREISGNKLYSDIAYKGDEESS